MNRAGQRSSFLAIFMGVAGCGASPIHVSALDEVERVRQTDAVREAAAGAPDAYSLAERDRESARRAHTAGDDTEAGLRAERALAGYGHALAIARLARAAVAQADAETSLAASTVQRQTLEATRIQLERDAEDLERRAQVVRGRLVPVPSGPASAERESARRSSARAMAVEAKLLCGAAKLVSPEANGLASAEGDIARLTSQVDATTSPAPIDQAARQRARCLDILTRARRGEAEDEGRNDALLAALSASGGWDPGWDERGILVTLRDAYRGAQLTEGAAARLHELGRVAASHPLFGLQVVVHDALTPPAKDATDMRRAEAAGQALVTGGAAAAQIDLELAGARAPLADPNDPRSRARNERIDVVFVGHAPVARHY